MVQLPLLPSRPGQRAGADRDVREREKEVYKEQPSPPQKREERR